MRNQIGGQLGRRDQIKERLNRRGVLLPALLVFVGLFLYVPRLGSYPLLLWDEAIYANAARHMAKDGYWLIPHMYWNPTELTPFLRKPPLGMWLQAISMSVFGYTAFAVRLPSALMTIALAVLVYRMGTELYDWRTGFAGGLLLLILPSIYKYGHSGSSGALDTSLVFFGSLFVWLTWQARDDAWKLLPAGVSAGLAVMVKGFAAGTFLFVLLPIVLVNWREYINRYTALGAGMAALVSLPWPIYVWFHSRSAFVSQFVMEQVRRSQGQKQVYGEPLFSFMNYPYFDYIVTSRLYAPFVISAVLYVGWSAYKKGLRNSRTELLLFWWMMIVPVSFAFVGGNHPWYILPMIVPLALLLGKAVTVVATGLNALSTRFFDSTVVSDRLFVLAGVLLVSCAAIGYPLIEAPPPDDSLGQRDIGQSLASIPADETVYIHDSVIDQSDGHFAFAFYANHPIDTFGSGELRDTPDAEYAVVTEESAQRLNRPYSVLDRHEATRLVAVKFTTTRDERSSSEKRIDREASAIAY